MREKFNIDVSYRQVSLFSTDLENPFNDWTEESLRAGHSYRLESCSFSADEDGMHEVHVIVEGAFPEPDPAAVRSIEVVLQISSKAELEVASISDSSVLPLRAGRYRVRSEYLPASGVNPPRFILAFVPFIKLVC